MNTVVKDFLSWAVTVFDVENINSVVERIEEEVIELKESPDDPFEIVDIIFFAVWYAHLKGWDLTKAMADKLEILKARQWEKRENGHYYRVK